jgi:hypothetical protein
MSDHLRASAMSSQLAFLFYLRCDHYYGWSASRSSSTVEVLFDIWE